MWSAILAGVGGSLGGYDRASYIAYALWAIFIGRVTTNWMYEFTMLNDIDSGGVNSILVRPISFYEFYLSQFVGYKLTVLCFSMIIPILFCYVLDAPFLPQRLPAVLLLITYYLVFAHTVSFCVACMAFFMNRAQGFTAIKNLAIWVLAGELVPLDLYPEPFRSWLLHSPFASGTYIPVAYLTGRIGPELMTSAFVSVTCGLVVVCLLAVSLWKLGLREYAGTGA
jgi:ABC-2 type transport system permease protein